MRARRGGRKILAQRFIAGSAWIGDLSPVGTAEPRVVDLLFCRAYGTQTFSLHLPSAEALG